jgi:hypothetical protein
LTDDRDDLAGAAGIDEDQPFAAEAIQILFDDPAHEHGGDAGIERVATFQQRLERGGGRERMPRGHGAIASHDRRLIGGPVRPAGERDPETYDDRYRSAPNRGSHPADLLVVKVG